MLFARRHKPNWREWLRIAAWPRRSWTRSVDYVRKRTWRISASPHAVALGFAIGTLMSFTPFMGFHILFSAALAWVMGVSMLASGLGTVVGNPITFPFIWASTYGLGNWILGRTETIEKTGAPNGHTFKFLWEHLDLQLIWDPLLKPMLVGAVPLGLLVAIACYFPIRKAVSMFQARRRHLVQKRINSRSSAVQ